MHRTLLQSHSPLPSTRDDLVPLATLWTGSKHQAHPSHPAKFSATRPSPVTCKCSTFIQLAHQFASSSYIIMLFFVASFTFILFLYRFYLSSVICSCVSAFYLESKLICVVFDQKTAEIKQKSLN